MKKIVSLFCLVSLTLLLVACGNKATSTKESEVTTYQTIHLKEVTEKIQNKEDFYLYVGRPTCPYCAKFAPNLEKAIKNTQVSVYYLNTDEEETAAVETFAKQEGIRTVPNLGYYQAGEKINYLEKGSQSSIKEIEDFLKQ